MYRMVQFSMDLLSRKEAKQRGLTRYFTAKACPRGHIVERLVSNKKCYTCHREMGRKHQKRHRDKALQRGRNWYAKNIDRERARSRIKSRRRAGLPEPTRPCPEMCEACDRKSWKALALDHCHITGRFRGWLCDDCNMGLGRLGDTVESVERMLTYLRKE